jgi:hypothetical protein
MKARHLLVALGPFLVAPLALAGYVQPAPVVVDLEGGIATGDMVSARFAGNDVELIGCGVRVFRLESGDLFEVGFCQASDANGVEAFCSTEDPGLLNVMKATGDLSFVVFAWDAELQCTRIGFSTQSFYIPNSLKPKKHD